MMGKAKKQSLVSKITHHIITVQIVFSPDFAYCSFLFLPVK